MPRPSCVFIARLLVLLVLLWGGLGCRLAYLKLCVHYELTTQRFVHKRGILTRVTDRIEVIDIDDVRSFLSSPLMTTEELDISLVSSDRKSPFTPIVLLKDWSSALPASRSRIEDNR